MKFQALPSSYSFNASAGTITFSAQIPASQAAVLAVTNNTRGVLIYGPGKAGTWTSPTLTLSTSTTEMANNDSLTVWLDDGDKGSMVSGRSSSPTVTFTRPADTTPYGASDVIGSASTANHQALNVGVSGNLIQVVSASVVINVSSLANAPSTMRLHLFDAQPAAIADNAVFAVAAADRAKYCGFIDLPTPVVIGGGFLWTQSDYVGRPIRLASTGFFFNLALTAPAGHTPASATEFMVEFHCVEMGV